MAEKKEAKGRVQLPPFCVGSELHLIINCSSPVQAEPKKAKVHAEDKAWQSSRGSWLGPLLSAPLPVTISRRNNKSLKLHISQAYEPSAFLLLDMWVSRPLSSNPKQLE